MNVAKLIAALALALLSFTAAPAQSSGGLRIRVIDNSDKAAVTGAAVTLSSKSKLVAMSTIRTDAEGFALFPVLRAGSGYLVTVIMDGYAGIRQEVVVTNGTTKDVAIALATEHVENVVVADEKLPVDLDTAQTSTSFSSDFIADLPVAGRFYQNVLALAPGVQDPDGDGNPNVNGARERDFKTQVSGISNVDPLTGTYLNLVTSDSIEDLTVITAGAGVEFGRAQGGFAQIIQKQGSNNFEGVFGVIYSSKLLDGGGSTGNPDYLVPDFYNYQPSLQVSGPIVPDKLWYRLSQEMISREDPVVLSGGATKTQGTRRFSTDNQLTWQVSNRNKLAFNFRADPLTETNVGIGTLTPQSSTEKQKTGGPTYTLTWTAPYSPSLLIDSTVAYQNTHFDRTPTDPNAQNNCYHLTPALAGAQCFNAQNGQTSGASPRVWQDSRQRFTVKSDATYYKGRMWGATHQFKFGLVIEDERYFRSLEQGPTFVRSTDLSGPSHTPRTSFTVTASLDPESSQRAVGNAVGIYGEDIIRPLTNLSLTVGLRIDEENVNGPGFKPFDPQAESNAFVAGTVGLDSIKMGKELPNYFIKYEDQPGALHAIQAQFPDLLLDNGNRNTGLTSWNLLRQRDDIDLHNTNVAPRLSLSWDPWNDGKTKFAASVGRYYDKIFLAVITTESEPVDATFQITEGQPHVSFDPTYSATTVDRNLKTPYNDEYTLSAERAFLQENSITLTYVHRSFKRQLERHSINEVPGDYGRCVIPQLADQPSYVKSPGTPTLVDPYTGVTYKDTDPGNGDGRLDDCTGNLVKPPNGSAGLLSLADGTPDLYVLNPAWGDIRELGNQNTAFYEGLTLEFVRRQYKNWQMEASYTLSRAIGDSEDFSLLLGDDRSTATEERGYLSYDRTHAFKVNATCITPWGFRLGTAINWSSGLPYSIVVRNASAAQPLPLYTSPVDNKSAVSDPTFLSVRTRYPTEQRNDQRNGSAWNFDVNLVKEVSLPKGMNLQIQAKIFNLFGEDTYVVYNSFTKRGEQVNGTNDATRRFGRRYEVGFRLAF